MPPASGTWSRSCRSRVSAAAITAGIHSPAGIQCGAPRTGGLLGVERFTEAGRVLLAGAVAPARLAGVRHEHHRAHHTVGQRFGVAVGVVGPAALEPGRVGLVGDKRDGAVVAAERRAGERQAPGRIVEGLADGLAPGLGVAAVVDLVEDHQRPAVLGAHAVTGRVAGDLGIGDDHAVVLRRRLRVGVGELRVQRDAGAGRGRRPLHLEVFGGHHDGHLVDGALGEQFGRDAQGERRLAGTGRRDSQEVTRFGSQVFHQRPSLPAP